MCGTNFTMIHSFSQEVNHRCARKLLLITLLIWPVYTNNVSLKIIGLSRLDMICLFRLEDNDICINKRKLIRAFGWKWKAVLCKFRTFYRSVNSLVRMHNILCYFGFVAIDFLLYQQLDFSEFRLQLFLYIIFMDHTVFFFHTKSTG